MTYTYQIGCDNNNNDFQRHQHSSSPNKLSPSLPEGLKTTAMERQPTLNDNDLRDIFDQWSENTNNVGDSSNTNMFVSSHSNSSSGATGIINASSSFDFDTQLRDNSVSMNGIMGDDDNDLSSNTSDDDDELSDTQEESGNKTTYNGSNVEALDMSFHELCNMVCSNNETGSNNNPTTHQPTTTSDVVAASINKLAVSRVTSAANDHDYVSNSTYSQYKTSSMTNALELLKRNFNDASNKVGVQQETLTLAAPTPPTSTDTSVVTTNPGFTPPPTLDDDDNGMEEEDLEELEDIDTTTLNVNAANNNGVTGDANDHHSVNSSTFDDLDDDDESIIEDIDNKHNEEEPIDMSFHKLCNMVCTPAAAPAVEQHQQHEYEQFIPPPHTTNIGTSANSTTMFPSPLPLPPQQEKQPPKEENDYNIGGFMPKKRRASMPSLPHNYQSAGHRYDPNTYSAASASGANVVSNPQGDGHGMIPLAGMNHASSSADNLQQYYSHHDSSGSINNTSAPMIERRSSMPAMASSFVNSLPTSSADNSQQYYSPHINNNDTVADHRSSLPMLSTTTLNGGSNYSSADNLQSYGVSNSNNNLISSINHAHQHHSTGDAIRKINSDGDIIPSHTAAAAAVTTTKPISSSDPTASGTSNASFAFLDTSTTTTRDQRQTIDSSVLSAGGAAAASATSGASINNNNNGSSDSLDDMWKRLHNAMSQSAETQHNIQMYDKAQGLRRNHSPSVVNSSRSRTQLQKGVILTTHRSKMTLSAAAHNVSTKNGNKPMHRNNNNNVTSLSAQGSGIGKFQKMNRRFSC